MLQLIAITILASALSMRVSSLPAVSNATQRRAADTCGYPTVALLRGWNPSTTDHFYTPNPAEMEVAIASLGYESQGDAGAIFPSQAPNSVPLYRLWLGNGADHFYTTSAAQRDAAVAQGYVVQGLPGYVYPSALCGAVPLYRAYNPTDIDHFYTTNKAEKDVATASLGYVDEGIAAYVIPA